MSEANRNRPLRGVASAPRLAFHARLHAVVGIALLSACGGVTPGVDASGVLEDASAAEASGADAEVVADAGADAAEYDAATEPDAAGQSQDASPTLDASEPDAGQPSEAGASEASTLDAGSADAGGPDAGPKKCIYGFQPNYAFCAAAGALEAERPISAQDTKNGAQADCAAHPSGPGGFNLYYRVKVPAGRDTRVVATATRAMDSAVVRVLANCYAEKAETGVRGEVGGRAAVCIFNRDGGEREVTIAVGRYSGEDLQQTLQFDLNVMHLPADMPCSW